MDAIWVVVANQAEACIYNSNQRTEILTVIDEFVHEAGKVHFQELVSDAPGRVHDRQGAARHSMEPDVGVQQESIRRFARKIVDYLEAAAEQGKYRHLILVAAPAFLGVIRKYVDRPLADRVVQEIPKDMVGGTVDQLQALLNRKL
jgi:protein required for attachment to host cells